MARIAAYYTFSLNHFGSSVTQATDDICAEMLEFSRANDDQMQMVRELYSKDLELLTKANTKWREMCCMVALYMVTLFATT